MVIAIDGTSGSGKSTLAKILSERLGINRFNVGMVYRAVSAKLYNDGIMPTDSDKISEFVQNAKICVEFVDGVQTVYINDVKMENHNLFKNDTSLIVPKYAQIPEIREVVRAYQRKFASTNSVLMEGRDITGEVLPDADVKFFIDCKYFVKSKRRQLQLKEAGQVVEQKKVMEQMFERDMSDAQREISPMKIVENVNYIDTSYLTIEQTIDKMLSIVRRDYV